MLRQEGESDEAFEARRAAERERRREAQRARRANGYAALERQRDQERRAADPEYVERRNEASRRYYRRYRQDPENVDRDREESLERSKTPEFKEQRRSNYKKRTPEQTKRAVAKRRAYRLGLEGELHVGPACEICGRSDVRLCLDHDHTTGAVRGTLCGNCNTAIGLLYEDPVRFEAAVGYLRRHGR